MAELELAFWDTSALVPLCIQQKGSNAVEQLSNEYSITAWWTAPVEMRSAFARLLRMGLLSTAEYQQAQKQIELLHQSWREIQPHDSVRSLAGSLLHQFPLRAADALQLAAALTWSRQQPQRFAFLAGDKQLLTAAEAVGFRAIEV